VQNGSGCGYIEWHDPPLPKFWSDLMGDLRDEVWRLRAGTVPHQPEEEAGTLAMLQSLEVQFKEKNEEIASLKWKYENVMFVLVVFVIGLVAGKLLAQ
jgi:hypothetical protein